MRFAIRLFLLVHLLFYFQKISFGSNTYLYTASIVKNYTVQHFEQDIYVLYERMSLKQAGLHYDAFRAALIGYYNMLAEGKLGNKNILSIANFEQPSSAKRLYVIDLKNKKLLYKSLCAHGQKTGDNYAEWFSNTPNSHKSSLGFYTTAETYSGEHGYSLRFDGIETEFNTNARDRAIVMHAADYVSENFVKQHGRLGRSHGCPAVSPTDSKPIINTIKGGTCFFIYKDASEYTQKSRYLNLGKAAQTYLQAGV